MKNVLVSGYIGFNNFGDEVIFKILKNHLQNLGCNVTALSSSANYNIKTYNYKSLFDIIKAILNCDILISGGGSLLQNKTSNFSLIYYLSIIFLSKLFLKKVIIFAQGIEPINGKFFEIITKTILKLCDFVSVRDKKSYQLLESWNIKTILLSDPAFSISDEVLANNNKQGLLVQLRDFKGLKKNFVFDLANSVVKHCDCVNVIAFQKEYDEKICKEFINEFEKLGGRAKYIYNENIDKTIDIINSCEYIISTRLHGLIVGSVLKSNVFALSYDEKIKTLVDELNILNIDLYNYTFEELGIKLNKFFESKNQTYQYRKFSWEDIDKQIQREKK